MNRSERRPTKRRAQMNRIAAFDRDAPALEDRLYQLDLAHQGWRVQSRASIDATGGFIETETEHEARRLPATGENACASRE